MVSIGESARASLVTDGFRYAIEKVQVWAEFELRIFFAGDDQSSFRQRNSCVR